MTWKGWEKTEDYEKDFAYWQALMAQNHKTKILKVSKKDYIKKLFSVSMHSI
jgi:hypothetical protein